MSVEEAIVCPRCHGDGEIEINRSRINDPQCAEPVRCPECHGTGVVTEPWPHESCFECRLRMPSDEHADAHYALTGHQMGWPDVDEMAWPLATDAQASPTPVSEHIEAPDAGR